MSEARGDPDLAQKTLGARRQEIRPHHLQRDRSIVCRVAREIDRGHAATADLTVDRISAGDGRGDSSGVGHGDSASRSQRTLLQRARRDSATQAMCAGG